MDGFAELFEDPRRVCEGQRDMLREFARIHLDIDAPDHRLGDDDPDWILRLRKVCLHVLAMTRWEISAGAVHVMATELRAAYVQMDAIWKCVPEECRVDKMYESWWADQARAGPLATYDHPTSLGLILPLPDGGFDKAEDPNGYARIASFLGYLGVGYGLALTHLATTVGAETDVDSRVTAVMRKWAMPSGTAWQRSAG